MAADMSSHHDALILDAVGGDFRIAQRTTPQPISGSAIIKVLEVPLLSYHREIYSGQRPYPFTTPMVGGCSAMGRVVAVGPDAAALQPGQLVWVDCVVRGRDDRSAIYLWGIHEGFTDGSRKLARDVWHDGMFAEFAKVPLENCIAVNEARLCQDLGYSIRDLAYLFYLLVPYGGLRDIKLEPGETVVVCPATGGFGGAGVQVAVAMGARVIAMGRNEQELARLKSHVVKGTTWASIETVRITGDEAADTASLQAFGTIDAVLDISPPAAAKSTHLKSAIAALRRGGRCSIMGYVEQPIVGWHFMANDLSLRGKLMYEREDMLLFVKMLERGMFPKAKDFVDVKSYGLKDWKEAFDVAAEYTGVGKLVVITP